MTVLPIVERELRVASRRAGTYWVRVAAAMVGIAGWTMLMFVQDFVAPGSRGTRLFQGLFSIAFVYCLLGGARLTADCLSEEKREDTLGLLFLTDLKGYDIVFGKLAATSLNSLYGLLAILPVMALTTQLGGVTPAELVKASLVLLNTLFFSLSAGLWVSTLSRNERKAMFAALLTVVGVTVGPAMFVFLLAIYLPGPFEELQVVWPVLSVSPGYAFGVLILGSIPSSPFPAWSFWGSLLLVHLLAWLFLSMAGNILPRIWRRGASLSRLERERERIEQLAYGSASDRHQFRRRLLDINPFLWLAARQRWKHLYVWLYLVAVGGTWLWGWFKYGDVMMDRRTLIPTILIFQAFLKVWVVSEACTRLVEDRRSGALELLLSTPLGVSEIVKGQWLSLRRQFERPLLVILVLEFIVLGQEFSTTTILVNQLVLVADMVALGWISMWLGLTARSANRAILVAIGLVLVLPWVIHFGGTLIVESVAQIFHWRRFYRNSMAPVYSWAVISLSIDIGLGFLWARNRLLRDFRSAAVERVGTRMPWWRTSASGHLDDSVVDAAVATS
jgi:hypothetical protein